MRKDEPVDIYAGNRHEPVAITLLRKYLPDDGGAIVGFAVHAWPQPDDVTIQMKSQNHWIVVYDPFPPFVLPAYISVQVETIFFTYYLHSGNYYFFWHDGVLHQGRILSISPFGPGYPLGMGISAHPVQGE